MVSMIERIGKVLGIRACLHDEAFVSLSLSLSPPSLSHLLPMLYPSKATATVTTRVTGRVERERKKYSLGRGREGEECFHTFDLEAALETFLLFGNSWYRPSSRRLLNCLRGRSEKERERERAGTTPCWLSLFLTLPL